MQGWGSLKASRESKITQAFVMTTDDLTRIVSLLTEKFPRVSISAKCADGIERTFSSLDDFASYENPPSKELLSVRVRATSQDFDGACIVRLDNDEVFNVYLNVDADEDAVLALSSGFNERLAAMRPWYYKLSSVTASMWPLYAPFVILFVIIPNARSFVQGKLSLPSFNYPVWFYMVVLSLTVLASLFYLYLDKLRHRWFPMGVFCMGQGQKRHSDREIIRTGVIVAFAVSIRASVAIAPFL